MRVRVKWTSMRFDNEYFAQRMRDLVDDEPKEFAHLMQVSLSATYNYLSGRIPSTEVLFRIAQITGRPMEWFLKEREVPIVESAEDRLAAEIAA